MLRNALLVLSALGTLAFGGAFVASFIQPVLIERAAREVLRIEVERRVGQKIDELSNSRIAAFAKKSLKQTQNELDGSAQRLRAQVPQKVANVVADMMRADCECRKRLVEKFDRYEKDQLSSLTQVRDKLQELVESTYASVTANLMREFRIFAGSNAVAFALLGLLAALRGRASLQLALAAVCLIGAVAVTGSLYIFSQDWLHTIVFGDYTGFLYSLYLGGVALVFADVLMNRARVTTQVVNLVFSAVGATISAVPC